jgi:hypothetical protein
MTMTMKRLTQSEARATLKKHKAKLAHRSYGYFRKPEGGHEMYGCAVSTFLLHLTQDPAETKRIIDVGIYGPSSTDHIQLIAEAAGIDAAYLRGLETGFEEPDRTAHYKLDDAAGRLGHEDGAALRDLVK